MHFLQWFIGGTKECIPRFLHVKNVVFLVELRISTPNLFRRKWQPSSVPVKVCCPVPCSVLSPEENLVKDRALRSTAAKQQPVARDEIVIMIRERFGVWPLLLLILKRV